MLIPEIQIVSSGRIWIFLLQRSGKVFVVIKPDNSTRKRRIVYKALIVETGQQTLNIYNHELFLTEYVVELVRLGV